LRSFVQVFYCSKNNGLSSRGCSAFLGWGAMSLRVQETVLRDEFACHDGAGGGGGPLLGGRGSVMPASRLAVFCPSLFAVFHRSPLAACLKVSRAFRHPGLALTPFSPLPMLRERGGMAPHVLGSPAWQISANGQAANIPPCSILGVNEPSAASHHSPFARTARRSPLAISEVTRRCPEMLPLAFHHSPFAVRHSPL
jgi:hypothetical protein